MSTTTRETQETQIAVVYPNGKRIQLVGALDIAESRKNQLNAQARALGEPESARIVKRHLRRVTTEYADPWQEVRWS